MKPSDHPLTDQMASNPPPREHHKPPFSTRPDGPLAMWLDAVLLSSGLLGGVRLVTREDRGDGPWTAGSVQYVAPDGGALSATIQRTPHPLRDQVFTYDGECQIDLLPSGTETVLREVDPTPSGFAQVMLRRAEGVFAQVTAGGIPGKGVPRPLSTIEVRSMAHQMDAALDQEPPAWPNT